MTIHFKDYDKYIKVTENKGYAYKNIIHETTFNSLGDLLQSYKEYLSKNEEHKNNSYVVNYDYTGIFSGGSFDMALNVDNSRLSIDVLDFSRIAENVKKQLNDSFSSPEYFNDINGLCFDVAEVLNGRPECWFNVEDQKEKKLNIIINMVMDCEKSKEQIINKGACILGLIDALKENNIALNVLMTLRSRNYDKKKHILYDYILNINIDVDMISPETFRFMVCNPLMIRRVFVFLVEIMTKKTNLAKYGYYGVNNFIPEREKIEENTLVFTSDFAPRTIKAGIDFIKSNIKDIAFNDNGKQLITI